MIAAITGELTHIDEDRVQVQCGPMLYDILVPASDIESLRAMRGTSITLHTIFDLEGDATRGGLTPRLIGFIRAIDKEFFQLFITVKGIGPKRALRALVHPTGEIAQAIENKDTRYLVQLPEVGKRTAEQIVAELAGKAKSFAIGHIAEGGKPISSRPQVEQTAIEGAIALGIPRGDAERLLDRAQQGGAKLDSTELLLREMLRLRSIRA